MQTFTALATRPHGHHPYFPWLTKGAKNRPLLQWHIYCAKPCCHLASVKFIARPTGNEIPCGFADHQCSEGLPIVRFIGTKVADLFSSTPTRIGAFERNTLHPGAWHGLQEFPVLLAIG
jgi:hypothetical protein